MTGMKLDVEAAFVVRKYESSLVEIAESRRELEDVLIDALRLKAGEVVRVRVFAERLSGPAWTVCGEKTRYGSCGELVPPDGTCREENHVEAPAEAVQP